ncbi:hypothetical protein CBL_07614 [Carabus blaptoides fortunei]
MSCVWWCEFRREAYRPLATFYTSVCRATPNAESINVFIYRVRKCGYRIRLRRLTWLLYNSSFPYYRRCRPSAVFTTETYVLLEDIHIYRKHSPFVGSEQCLPFNR